MKILVTGATGLFGPILVKALQEEGHGVRVLVHDKPLQDPDAEIVQGDITSDSDIRKACAGVDGICHLATAKGKRETFLPVNLGGLYRILDFMQKETSPPMLIHLSGDNTVPIFDYENVEPIDETHPCLFGDDEYGLSKVLEEVMAIQYIRKYHLPITILRSSWIMEGMRATRLCHPRRGGWKKYLDDEQREKMEKGEDFRVVPHDKYDNPLKRHVVDPRDLAAAFLCAIKDEKSVGELFNISGPSPFNYQKLADFLNNKEPLPTYKISTPDAFSFEINVRKAKKIGFTPKYSIFDTVGWALNGNPL